MSRRIVITAVLLAAASQSVAGGMPSMDLPRLEFPTPAETCVPPTQCVAPR